MRNQSKLVIRPRSVIVVGGGTGIGYATVQRLLDEGVEYLIIVSRDFAKLESAKSTLKYNKNQHVCAFRFDITDIDSHEKMIELVANEIGRVPEGLVISAGINYDGSNWRGFNISEQDWDSVMNTNLKGVFFLTRTFSNYLHARQIKGNICLVSSISAHRDLLSVYQVTKNAISGIVHAYGKHLCERGIVLNCVEPGTTNTDMMKGLEDYTDGIRPGKQWADNSIRRLIRPEEIAEVICFLMSEAGEIMAGSCVLAGGGCKSIAK